MSEMTVAGCLLAVALATEIDTMSTSEDILRFFLSELTRLRISVCLFAFWNSCNCCIVESFVADLEGLRFELFKVSP